MRHGKHLIIDAYGCDYDSLWNTELIQHTLLKVTSMIGLRPLSDTLIYEVDDTMISKEDTGVTGGIIFMESHFTMARWNWNNCNGDYFNAYNECWWYAII